MPFYSFRVEEKTETQPQNDSEIRGYKYKEIAERLIANNMDWKAVVREGYAKSSAWRVCHRMQTQGKTPDDFLIPRLPKRTPKKKIDKGDLVDDNGNGEEKGKVAPIAGVKIGKRPPITFRMAEDEVEIRPDDLYESYYIYKKIMAVHPDIDNPFSDMMKFGFELAYQAIAAQVSLPVEQEKKELVGA